MKPGIANMTSPAWAAQRPAQTPPPPPARPQAAPPPKPPQQTKRDRGVDGRFAINDGGKRFR